MPNYIVRPDPLDPWYFVWSTVVDSPTYWGTLEELKEDYPEYATDRISRANARGSSCFVPNWYYYDDPNPFTVRHGVPSELLPADAWTISVARENMKEFCLSYDEKTDMFNPNENIYTIDYIED